MPIGLVNWVMPHAVENWKVLVAGSAFPALQHLSAFDANESEPVSESLTKGRLSVRAKHNVKLLVLSIKSRDFPTSSFDFSSFAKWLWIGFPDAQSRLPIP